MRDYVSALTGAVAALGPNAGDDRRALYDRARRELLERLRSAEPALSDTEIDSERTALETAIQRVESVALTHVPPRETPPLAPDQPIAANDDTPAPRGVPFHLVVSAVGVALIIFVLMLGYSR